MFVLSLWFSDRYTDRTFQQTTPFHAIWRHLSSSVACKDNTMVLRLYDTRGCSNHTASTFFKEVLQSTWSSDPLDGSPYDHHHMKKTNVRRRQQDGHASWQRRQKSSQREHCWTWLKLNQREQQAFCLRPTLLLEVVKGGLSN